MHILRNILEPLRLWLLLELFGGLSELVEQGFDTLHVFFQGLHLFLGHFLYRLFRCVVTSISIALTRQEGKSTIVK